MNICSLFELEKFFSCMSEWITLPWTLFYTVMRNYSMNQDFADINSVRDFQRFNDEKNSHLQTKSSWSKTT